MPSIARGAAARFLSLMATLSLTMVAACDEAPLDPSPASPAVGEGAQPVPVGVASLRTAGRWSDGYAFGFDAGTANLPLGPETTYNRAGGKVTLTRVAGSVGRYIATFAGLSAKQGKHSIVRTEATGDSSITCKPVNSFLVNDQVEIRCSKLGTGQAVAGEFFLLTTHNYGDVAFAFADQPTTASYLANARGSWNTTGARNQVTRRGIGDYLVSFPGMQAGPGGAFGAWLVTAVGPGTNHCKVAGTAPGVAVAVRCYTAGGAAADSKFNVLYVQRSGHVAYTDAAQPTTPAYYPDPAFTGNPGLEGYAVVNRTGVGSYLVAWSGIDQYVVDLGTAAVAGYGAPDSECRLARLFYQSLEVHCRTQGGAPVDSPFYVILGS